MIRTFCFSIALFLFIMAEGQPFANDWINYSQHYFKLYHTQKGICRLTSSDLTAAGIPVGAFNPQNLQIFYRGKEIPVYIKGEEQGLLEYLEFFVQPNDSWLDTTMFDSPGSVLNPYYSLINDTSAYFLTWNNAFSNKRYQPENDINFTGYTPISYVNATTVSQYPAKFLEKGDDCEYTFGEGWFDDPYLSLGGSVTKTVQTPKPYTAGGNAQVRVALAGVSKYSHHLSIMLNSTLLADTTYYGLIGFRGDYTVPSAQLNEQNVVVFSSINDQNNATDLSAVAYIQVSYRMQPNAGGGNLMMFELPSGNQKTLVEISQYGSSAIPSVYDLTRNKVIKCVLNSQTLKFLVPASTTPVKIIISAPEATLKPNRIKACQFINPLSVQSEYIIVSHQRIWESATVYKNYRNAVLADIDQLYDQFAYGIDKHPVAIRNYISFALSQWTRKPEYLLIAGKGVGAAVTRKSASAWDQCLVPPMGYPASDNLLSSRIREPMLSPALATGRIAAQTNSELMIYLDKVIAMQANTPDAWMKHIIHFSGGIDAIEQGNFARYLKAYETIIEDTLFGGYVSTFRKNSSSPIQITQTDSVKSLINGGVTFMTFFGHAAATVGFDQNIDEPSSYTNVGRYPFIMANSCYAGNIHLTTNSTISEKWILIANKGAIGFLASVNEGQPALLNTFSTNFYQQLAYESYGLGIGMVFRNTALKIFQQYPYSQGLKSTIQEFTLHGDPAVILNQFQQPDLALTNRSVWFEPREVTTLSDSFDVKIVVENYGKSVTQPFQVDVIRTYSDGTFQTYTRTIPKALFRDTLTVRFPVDHIKGTGLNQISVIADVNGLVNEFSETNNMIQVSLYIRSSDINPVYPPDQALVSSSEVILKASTGDVLAPAMQSRFEIDTSMLFTSPVTSVINHRGGVVTWQPPFNLVENRTYYWRVSRNVVPYNWKTSSLVYSPGESGWAQMHFYQFATNPLTFINLNPHSRQYDFIITPKELSCHNIGSPTIYDLYSVGFLINGSGDYGVCGYNHSVLVTVIDSATLQPWESNRGNYGHYNYPKCNRPVPDKYYMFLTGNPDALQAMANFINDTVPDGFYILTWSIINANITSWPENVLQTFENLGAAGIRSVPDNHPFIFYTRKGYPSNSSMVIGQSPTDVIDLSVTLRTRFTYGSVGTIPIGPSLGWKYLKWSAATQEENTAETILLSVAGISKNGTSQTLADSIRVDEDSVSLGFIPHTDYPYITLSVFSRDDEFQTPANLNYWKVMYDDAPEFAFNPRRGYRFDFDTVNEGEQVRCLIATENISGALADSLRMTYWLTDYTNNITVLKIHKIKAPLPGSWIIDSVSFSTLGKKGDQIFRAEVNAPDPATGRYDQPELNHFNNFLSKPFYVIPDKTNPLLDVTFDGLHITNGEIVSARPEIVVQLTDENKYLPLNDTSVFAIYLTYPGQPERRIAIEQAEWIPATLPKNSCKIIYRPVFDADGSYQLRIQARDISNNESGKKDYRVSFNIVTKATISEVLNYPNPFSTSTRFVFTLTGSEIPDDLKIQIMTISGKLVKTITREELGTIRIGRNIATAPWNGTDDFGDKLANGVYFYRVICTINGKEPEKNLHKLDKYFKEGFGKLYIMR